MIDNVHTRTKGGSGRSRKVEAEVEVAGVVFIVVVYNRKVSVC